MLLHPRIAEKGRDRLTSTYPDHEFILLGADEDPIPHAEGVEASFSIATEAFIHAAPDLRWIQVLTAGINNYPLDLILERGFLLTNAAGNYGPNMADHTMAFILMLSRDIDRVRRNLRADGWPKQKDTPDPGELTGQTLLILGLGGIGLETARRAAAFGMRIIATRRHSDRPVPDFVEAVHPPDALHDLLPQADWLDVCVPHTPDTTNLINDREFAMMKPSAHILCTTRGGIINTDALMRALDSGQIAGAGLDVTDPEPLPMDHPLWTYDNVIITPHTSGYAESANQRLEDLVVENTGRYLAERPLRNLVDLELRY
jgi:phosphoglycerate dehydrogenase-like enzyme